LLLSDFPASIAAFERALAVRERSLGPDHPEVASTLEGLGLALDGAGDSARAVTVFERVLAIREKTLGPDHPLTADALENMGCALVRARRLDDAGPILKRALTLQEKAHGASHPELDESLYCLGELALARGKPDEAMPVLEHALALHGAMREPFIEIALAEALSHLGRDPSRARELAERAKARFERIGHREGLERATRWLREHPAGK
jgi:serine/threonine-protein kinase